MIKVTRASNTEDLQEAFNIRRIVFIIGQNVAEEIEMDEFDEEASHVLAHLDGKVVGTARWRNTDQGAKLERFAVLEEVRGSGVGSALVDYVLDQIEDETTCYLNSQSEAIPFYEKKGFVAEGPVFYEADIPHRKMIYKPGN